MTLEVSGKLPRGARLVLEAPAELVVQASKAPVRFQKLSALSFAKQPRLLSKFNRLAGRKQGVRYYHVNPFGRLRLHFPKLPRGSQSQMRLLVHLPKPDPRIKMRLVARQLYRGDEVGRVTWQVGIPKTL